MGRTIPAPHHSKPKRVEQVATYGNSGSQQQQEFHYRFRAERTTDWMGTPTLVGTALRIEKPNCQRISIQHASQQAYGYPCPQQGRLRNQHPPKPMDNRATRMARREELTTTIWNSQTCAPMTRTIQNHPDCIPSCSPTRTSGPMEHSSSFPH
jgi:hypothetical protein